jgi:S1-C subfamily serine protease
VSLSSFTRALAISSAGVLLGAVGGVVLVAPALAPGAPPASCARPPEPIVVESVSGDSPFASLGIRAGDKIEAVDHRQGSIYITLLRDGQRLHVVARGVQNPFPTGMHK